MWCERSRAEKKCRKMECGDAECLDFLLRNSDVDIEVIKKVLYTIPISNPDDSRLKKTLLLRTMEHHISTLSITEHVLETLELFEELLRLDASPVTAAMSAAYCAVAVECTLKHLQLDNHNNADYLDAVNSIWLTRVCYMKGSADSEGSLMFSPELERWSRDIEASVSDSQVRERLASFDSKGDAIAKLRVFLAEARAQLGPSLFQLAANNSLTGKHLEAQHHHKEIIQKCGSAAAESSSESQTLVKDVNSLKLNEEELVENQSGDADEPCPDGIDDNEVEVMEKVHTSIP